jgi:hypothetical protein
MTRRTRRKRFNGGRQIVLNNPPARMGMLQSMRMQSNGGDAWMAATTAAWPLSTTVQNMPAWPSMRFTIVCEGIEKEGH